jgi:hypothetical protein
MKKWVLESEKFCFVVICFRGNFTYPLKFGHFCRYSSIFKTSHFGVSNFIFLSLYPFRTENPNRISILPQNDTSFWKQYSFGVKGKIGIAKNFLYRRGKVREK